MKGRAMRGSSLGIAVAMTLMCAVPAEAQLTKVGYVDTSAILAEFAPAQEARRVIEAALQGFRLEAQTLESDFRAAVDEFQQQQLTMTSTARTAKENELAQRQVSIQQRLQELQAQAAQREEEVLTPVTDSINAVIEAIRVEGGYAIILDRAQPSILAADPALDLTADILARLQVQEGPPGDAQPQPSC